ncbi:sulfite exporter TauE/SafE family protein [Chitinophaga sancti]|uniref:sulfite exporter TauE/SafE family protein n=1 Tax=Chitinophaga sancti TaxID=1004 RepID=UPI003F794307
MHLFGYISSLAIGISLGLIGGGGSILTMPVMVYLFGLAPITATSYSLFIVGSTSLVGAVRQYRQGAINIKMALLFATVSVLTVFLTRKYLLPSIPDHIGTIGHFPITSSWLTMVLFALIMQLSSFFMMRHHSPQANPDARHMIPFGKLAGFGIGIGLISGLLGVGGGFLLIPSLVLLLGVPMKEAVGSSLLVIALNSLIGFLGNAQDIALDWSLLSMVTLLAIIGILTGTYLNRKIPAARLKKGFGWFVLAIGVYVLIRETGRMIW